MWELIDGMGPQQVNTLVKVFAWFGSLKRSTATLNLPFMLRNVLMRDLMQAKFLGPTGHSFWRDTIPGIASMITGDESYSIFRTSKAGQAFFLHRDIDEFQRYMRSLDQHAARRFINQYVFHPFELLAVLGKFAEVGTRVGQVKRQMKAEGILVDGVINEDMLSEAVMRRLGVLGSEVTQDFSKKGRWFKDWNRVSAFMTARIGGWTRFAEALRPHPDVLPALAERRLALQGGPRPTTAAERKALSSAAYRTQAGIVASRGLVYLGWAMLLWMLNRDDEEYKRLDGADRSRNHHIPVPQALRDEGWGPFIRWARPFEFGDIANHLEAFFDWKVNEDPEFKRRVFFDGWQDAAWQAFLFLAPDVVVPPFENFGNVNTWTGGPLFDPYATGIDANLQYNRWTPELAKYLATWINEQTGATGADGIKPWQIDNLLEGYFTGVYRMVAQQVDRTLALAGEVPARPVSNIFEEVPIASEFARTARTIMPTPSLGTGGADITQFYEEVKRLEGAAQSIRRYVASGETGKARERAQAEGLSYRYEDGRLLVQGSRLRAVRAARNALGTIRGRMDRIYADQKMTGVEKQRELDALGLEFHNRARRALGKPPLRRAADQGGTTELPVR